MPEDVPLRPEEIERRSMAIIAGELGDSGLSPEEDAVLKRVVHASADFDYARTLVFSPGAVGCGIAALQAGCPIVTDTAMARAGINKRAAAALGCEVHCLVADAEVADAAKARKITRSRAAVDKAADLWPDAVYVVGNAPTALSRICRLAADGALRPRLVVGTPVGFVHVVESKELLLASALPHIVARGRKGGSAVAAAVVNALLYQATDKGRW